MNIDATKVIYASTLNAYKNTGVRSGTVTVSGNIAAGAIQDWTTDISLSEAAKYFTILVKTTSFTGGTVRWQAMPSALYYDVPASGPAASLQCLLAVIVNGTTVTLKVWTLNPYGSTITMTATPIEFKYVPYTLVS
jgi:hypothetical protein